MRNTQPYGTGSRLSDHYNLGLNQAELDFVDIPVDTDLPLFCDPYAFVIERDPWFVDCNELIFNFFSRMVGHIRSGQKERAMRMLSHVGEANEAHLGFSQGMPSGLGIGRVKAEQLYGRLERSRAVTTGRLYDLADCDLFIPGIGPDNISDMTINIIREKLLYYTVAQCQQLGIPMSPAQGGFRWDSEAGDWVNRYAELPVVNGARVLLIPKAAVRYHLSIDHREYYQHFVLNFLQAEHLRTGSSLVELFKNGKSRVTKKSLKEVQPLDKDFLFGFSEDHPEVLNDYKDRAKNESISLTDEKIEDRQRQEKQVDIESIVRKIRSVRTGMADAALYHKTMLGALQAIFYPQLRNLTVEREINEGRKRIDIVANNSQSTGFFGDLTVVNGVHCPYILIECKNYGHDIGNPELDQLIGRFSRTRGRFGLLTCRTIADKERILASCRDTLRDRDEYIVVLEDDDIIAMLEYRRIQAYNSISDYMHAKLRELVF